MKRWIVGGELGHTEGRASANARATRVTFACARLFAVCPRTLGKVPWLGNGRLVVLLNDVDDVDDHARGDDALGLIILIRGGR